MVSERNEAGCTDGSREWEGRAREKEMVAKPFHD